MSKRKAANAGPAAAIGQREVPFISTAVVVQSPGVTLHKKSAITTVSRTVAELKTDWNEMMQSVTLIIEDTERHTKESGFQLEEIEIGLGFNAKGKLAFIAEAGVEASLSVRFKRGTAS
jgi:hypothetical protein